MAEFADKTEIDEFSEYFQGVDQVLSAFQQKYLHDPIFQRGVDNSDIFEWLKKAKFKINSIVPEGRQNSGGFKIQQR